MTVHLLISGKVQGVFYRAKAKGEAENLGIKGWIKNTPDRRVEAVVNGNDQPLKQFVEWCKQGPATAIVTNVDVTEVPEQKFEEFEIIA